MLSKKNAHCIRTDILNKGLKSYTAMFIVLNGHYGGSLSALFLIFQKISFLAIFWRFLGQN